MNIAFLGNFSVSYTSENDYLWTFKNRLDCTVTPLQEGEVTGEYIRSVALGSDLFFWVHTHGWDTPGLPITEVLAELKKAGVPTVSYHLDTWLGLDRQKDIGTDPFWQIEHFFTVDKEMSDYLNARDQLPIGHYLKPGVVERDCYISEDVAFARDVIFVGSYGYHGQWPYRHQLIDFLRNSFPKFEHWGGDGLGTMRGNQLNELYASSPVAVGDSLCLNFTKGYYWSDRVYETLGRGGFLIHPYIKGLEEEFTDGETIVFYQFGNFEELRDKINYYLAHPIKRERIRQAGHEYVKANCTYTQRLAEMLGSFC